MSKEEDDSKHSTMNVEKYAAHNRSLIREQEELIKELRQRIIELENKNGVNQPRTKFKVLKKSVHAKTEEETLDFHNETAKEIGKQIAKRGGVKTKTFKRLLEEHDINLSKPSIHKKMEDYGRHPNYEFYERKKGVRKAHQVKYVG